MRANGKGVGGGGMGAEAGGTAERDAGLIMAWPSLRRLAEVTHQRLVEVTCIENRIGNRDEGGQAIIIHAGGVS